MVDFNCQDYSLTISIPYRGELYIYQLSDNDASLDIALEELSKDFRGSFLEEMVALFNNLRDA